jgi:hypothetical protein
MDIKVKVLLQSLLVGFTMLIIFILFEKITQINIPNWFGSLIIVGLIAFISKRAKSHN